MPRPSTVERAREEIIDFFKSQTRRVFRYSDLRAIFEEQRSVWNIAASSKLKQFIIVLLDTGTLKEQVAPFPHRSETRFLMGTPSIYAMVQTLKDRGYFSHRSALHLNGLTAGEPKDVYLNVEQRPHPPPSVSLTQKGLDFAFKGRQRSTSNIALIEKYRVHLLNGKYSNDLGVIEMIEPGGAVVRVTDQERTLIDAVVRPAYAGGVERLLRAYVAGRDKVSIRRLIGYLRELKHVYPYHQAIGYLLEQAGYPREEVDIMRLLPREFKFYLTHEMQDPEYVESWKLYIPRGFGRRCRE